MRHWKTLTDEAEAQLRLHQAMHHATDCDCGECPAPQCVREHSDILYNLDIAKMEACFTSRFECNFIARLSALRDFLDRTDVAKLQSLVSALAHKTAIVKAYETESDTDRFIEADEIWQGAVFDDDAKYGSDPDWSDDSENVGDEE